MEVTTRRRIQSLPVGKSYGARSMKARRTKSDIATLKNERRKKIQHGKFCRFDHSTFRPLPACQRQHPRHEVRATWSDRKIAEVCSVSHPFVAGVRSSLVTVTSEERTYTTKHGTTSTMKTGRIGGNSKPADKQQVVSRLHQKLHLTTSSKVDRSAWGGRQPRAGAG